MKNRLTIIFCLMTLIATAAAYEKFKIGQTEFVFQAPPGQARHIFVAFGGRNWTGEQTLRRYRLEKLAERHQLILLAPSFCSPQYWQPERGSGDALLQAIRHLEQRFRLTAQPVALYGYSAGGQCAALFQAWLPPGRVLGWGAHACGVYPVSGGSRAPALLSCGIEDESRLTLSRNFAYRYREQGGLLLWKVLRGNHELSDDALQWATAWFDALYAGKTADDYGEDDTGRVLPMAQIDVEFRNPLYSKQLKELWLK